MALVSVAALGPEWQSWWKETGRKETGRKETGRECL